MFVWRTYGTALWATAGGAIGLDNGIRPADTGSEYHGVGFTTFACVRFRTYRTPLVFRQHRDRRELQLAFLGSDRTRVCTYMQAQAGWFCSGKVGAGFTSSICTTTPGQ